MNSERPDLFHGALVPERVEFVTDSLLSSRSGSLLTLTLNRPERRNALTQELSLALARAVSDAEKDPGVRAIVLAGAGGHFCSGIDLQAAMEGADLTPEGRAALVQRTLVGGLHLASRAFWQCTKPTVAVLSGATVGFGLSLALTCDLRLIASDGYATTQFGARGLFPDGGLLYLIERQCGLGRALELTLRPTLKLSAAEVVALGLASRTVAPRELAAAGAALATELGNGAPLVQAAIKTIGRGGTFEEVLAAEVGPVVKCLTSEDALEGLTSFLEKRAPVFKGK